LTILALAERLVAASCVVAGVLAGFRFAVARAPALGHALGRVPFGRVPFARERALAVLETAFLPNGASLHVIRVGTRRFVVGRSAAAFTRICELPDAPAATPGGGTGGVTRNP